MDNRAHFVRREARVARQSNALRVPRNPSLTLRVENELAGARSGEEERGKEFSSLCLCVSVVKISFCVLVVKIQRTEAPPTLQLTVRAHHRIQNFLGELFNRLAGHIDDRPVGLTV